MEFENAEKIKKLAINANGSDRFTLRKLDTIKKIDEAARAGLSSVRMVFGKNEITPEELWSLDCRLDDAGYKTRRVERREGYVLFIQWF